VVCHGAQTESGSSLACCCVLARLSISKFTSRLSAPKKGGI
jgi:hypothetical protein